MSDIALKLENISKRFRRGESFDSLRDLLPAMVASLFSNRSRTEDARSFWALRDVSFEVMRGEAFGIIGHNGAGKSTMLKILSRIMRPTSGQMTVNGRLSALIEVSAGFHQDLTGRENIFLNGVILGMSRREITGKLEAIVEFSGLADFIDTPVKRYSSGMYARLGFSIAAHVDPDVLIVDEVLSVGDLVFQQKCLARMRQVLKGGATVLFVSHNLRVISDLCQRSLLLDHGRALTVGPTATVIKSYMDVLRGRRETSSAHIAIQSVAMLVKGKERVQFIPGELARVAVEVLARDALTKVFIGLYIMDKDERIIFTTSTERLGHTTYEFQPGDTLRCDFELELALGPGAYHMCAVVDRNGIDEPYDYWQPAVTFYVGSPYDQWSGLIPCKPRLLRSELRSGHPNGRLVDVPVSTPPAPR